MQNWGRPKKRRDARERANANDAKAISLPLVIVDASRAGILCRRTPDPRDGEVDKEGAFATAATIVLSIEGGAAVSPAKFRWLVGAAADWRDPDLGN